MLRIGHYQQCRLKYCQGKAVNSRTLYTWYKKSKCATTIQSGDDAIKKLQEEFKVYNVLRRKNFKKNSKYTMY
jgi:hypothetical protein